MPDGGPPTDIPPPVARGTVIAAYREPFGAHWVALAALPLAPAYEAVPGSSGAPG